ncbi:hypothetical protein [Sphingomonas aerolata]|uniref:hypothetical protein n=1 Tax=Sphingomonas aerolata TaxID=185951 RepID=UPI00336516AE
MARAGFDPACFMLSLGASRSQKLAGACAGSCIAVLSSAAIASIDAIFIYPPQMTTALPYTGRYRREV